MESHIDFAALVTEMVHEDLKAAERDEWVLHHGYTIIGHKE